MLVASIYLPNGNPQPGPKFGYKLAWFERLIAHAAELLQMNVPAVLAGDYNVVPTDRDIYSTRSWSKNALLQPEPRAAYRRLLEQGWTDALLETYPDGSRSSPEADILGTRHSHISSGARSGASGARFELPESGQAGRLPPKRA